MVISVALVLLAAGGFCCFLPAYIHPIFLISNEMNKLWLINSKIICKQNAITEALVRTTLLTWAIIVAIYRNDNGASLDLQHVVFIAGVSVLIFLFTFWGALIANVKELSKLKGGCDGN